MVSLPFYSTSTSADDACVRYNDDGDYPILCTVFSSKRRSSIRIDRVISHESVSSPRKATTARKVAFYPSSDIRLRVRASEPSMSMIGRGTKYNSTLTFSGYNLQEVYAAGNGSRIVTQGVAQRICNSLPISVRFFPWYLAYRPLNNGTSMQTFYRNLAGRGASLLFIRDANGRIFGAFATDSWEPHCQYFGGGEAFVFSVDDEGEVEFFRNTSSNAYFQFASEARFAMGAGDQAIAIEDNLLRGVSKACSTFGSPQLSIQEDFVVQDFEVWCFDDE